MDRHCRLAAFTERSGPAICGFPAAIRSGRGPEHGHAIGVAIERRSLAEFDINGIADASAS